MKTFIVISILVFLLGFIFFVVYCILTLIQIQKTAKQAEEVLKKINRNLENVTSVSDDLRKLISSSLPILTSVVAVFTTGVIRLLKNLFSRR